MATALIGWSTWISSPSPLAEGLSRLWEIDSSANEHRDWEATDSLDRLVEYTLEIPLREGGAL